tara:strand:+ start:82 stop:378 length:297 start_codon:yes stop_codon:yes gene_type:complete
MRKILGLLLVIGLTLAVVAEEKPKEIVEEKKEKITLKGWGSKFFDALDGEVDKTKEYQKKQWEKMKKQFEKLFNSFDRDWEEIDKEIEEKENETKEEK